MYFSVDTEAVDPESKSGSVHRQCAIYDCLPAL